jgi:hypothetical protein
MEEPTTVRVKMPDYVQYFRATVHFGGSAGYALSGSGCKTSS